MRRITAAIAAAIAAAVLAACSAGPSESAGDELSLRDFGARAFEDSPDRRALRLEVETKVAECMAAAGFDYIPYVESAVSGGLDFDRYGEEEYASGASLKSLSSLSGPGAPLAASSSLAAPTGATAFVSLPDDALTSETQLRYLYDTPLGPTASASRPATSRGATSPGSIRPRTGQPTRTTPSSTR